MAYRTSRERFEELVDRALEAVPGEFKDHFTNITVIVEDYPTRDTARQVDAKRGLLLGLFSGVPYPHKGGFFAVPHPLPDTIILYQKNIEALCSSEGDLIEEIKKTLVHEVGHYFGLSEDDLEGYE